MNCRNIVAIDVETTGLSPLQGHRVIEIAAVRFSNVGLGEEFHSLINCGRSVPSAAQRIHGISDRMLYGQPLPVSVFKRFKEFVGDCILVAHNASFDRAFIHQEYVRQGWTLTNPVQCTLNLSRRVLPHLRNYRLETVFRHLFPNENEVLSLHRALVDARVVAKIWLKMNSWVAGQQESSMQNHLKEVFREPVLGKAQN